MLIAEDEPVSRSLLERSLAEWGYRPLVCPDGMEALEKLQSPEAPRIAVLDWVMPGINGVDICRAIREGDHPRQPYLILLTARARPEDIVQGLRAGADDYITKPVGRDELQARLQVAGRIAALQQRLSNRVIELEQALARVRRLQGLLPSAPTASGFATIRTTGTRSRRTSPSTPTCNSATASARVATSAC